MRADTSAFTPASNSPVRTAWTRVPSPEGDFDAWLALPPAGHGPGLLGQA
ncbi:hypothetical protein [uncultured Sphaerotilus sp.]